MARRVSRRDALGAVAQREDLAAAEITVDVRRHEMRNGGPAIDVASRDGASPARGGVFGHGQLEVLPVAARRRLEAVGAFHDPPAIVAAAPDDVDLLPRVLAHVARPQLAPLRRSKEKRQGLRSPSAQISGLAPPPTKGLSGGTEYGEPLFTSMRSILPSSELADSARDSAGRRRRRRRPSRCRESRRGRRRSCRRCGWGTAGRRRAARARRVAETLASLDTRYSAMTVAPSGLPRVIHEVAAVTSR